jgi:N-acetylglucosaminyldiphosphoundecaprenol N-acetyl-beta-D-mannosaminyltransferase
VDVIPVTPADAEETPPLALSESVDDLVAQTLTATRLPTVSLMGLEVAAVSERDAINHVVSELEQGRGGWLCTVNLDILRQWKRSPAVRELVSHADMFVADGMPLVWASRLQGTPLPERVAGSTLTCTLTAAAAQLGASVFLIGGNPGVAERAGTRLTIMNPGLRLAGTLCPPFGFESQPDWLSEMEQVLVDAAPRIVYVGLGFPKQERVIARLRELLPDTWFVGCGISLSFIAGELERAPDLLQRLGLEWLYRLVQEPRRLWRRYLVAGLPFLVQLLASSIASR